jgi:peptidyl-prolyl cis-trans isomerase A (cyclophilin A)
MRNNLQWSAAVLLLSGCASEKPAAKAPEKIGPAPAAFRVKFETTKGDFVVAVTKDWAPLGVDRFYELVRTGFYDEARFYRVRPKFVVQWGVNKDPKVSALWRDLKIADDPVKAHNGRGLVTFATAGPNTRTTEVFINLADNAKVLDARGFAPFGKVVDGMDVVDQFFSGYGEVAPRGSGPDHDRMESIGNDYLIDHFPRLDYIKKAAVQ